MTTTRVLADTSVWIQYLRHGATGSVDSFQTLLESERLVVCGPVVAEIFAGTKAKDRDWLETVFAALSWVELDSSGWRKVGELAALLREGGEKLPLTDLVIAVTAQRAGAQLWSFDSDFKRIPKLLSGFTLYGSSSK